MHPMKKKTMINKQYTVGQILYLLPENKISVIPIQVVEEIKKKTLKGEEVSYVVRYSSNENEITDISNVKGELFDCSDNVKVALIERSTVALNDLVDGAVSQAGKWYVATIENPDNQTVSKPRKLQMSPQEVPKHPEEGVHEVQLPDGEIVRVSGLPKSGLAGT